MFRDADQVRFDKREPRVNLPVQIRRYYDMADGKNGYIDHIIEPSHKPEKMYHVVGDEWSIWAWESELTQVLDEPVVDEDQLTLFE